MSRRHCHCESRKHYGGCENNMGFLGGFGENGNCCCSFPTLVILILIILQFSRNKGFGGGRSSSTGGGIGSGVGLENNGILFIIALFFLACCNPCKRY